MSNDNNTTTNNNTGDTLSPAASAPSTIPSPPRTKRITTPVPAIGIDENISPNANTGLVATFTTTTSTSSGGLFGALPGVLGGDSTAPSYCRAANDLDVSSIGFDERLVLTAPDFQPVVFGDSGGQQQQHDTPQAAVATGDPFSSLSIDPLACCLSHLSALDIDSLRLTSKSSLAQCTSSPVWRLHCLRTGKVLPQDNVPSITSSSQIREAVSQLPSSQDDRFFDLYRSSICVPEDCGTLAAAIRLAVLKDIKVITLMPGDYRERIAIDGDFIEDIVSTVSSDGGNSSGRHSSGSTRTGSNVLAAAGNLLRGRSTHSSRSTSRAASSSARFNEIMERGINLEIRAANPRLLTTLAHISGTADGNGRNNAAPTVSVDMDPNSNLEAMMLSDEGAGVSLTLSNLSIISSVPGTDIWTTNTAIRASGNGVTLDTRNCLVTSMSGRGIVITGGASGDLVSTTVFNCAATGIYVGDEDTEVTLKRCNVVNCGYGGRPIASSSSLLPVSTTGSTSDLLKVIESSVRIQTLPVTVGNETIVPSGHSGIYVEAADMVLEDSLISGSCLTGITAVRGGRVALTGCDLADNAAEDISTQDSFLVERAQLNDLDEDMEGTVHREEANPNRFHGQSELHDDWPSKIFRRFDTGYFGVCDEE